MTASVADGAAAAAGGAASDLVAVEDLTVRFGGVTAVSHVSLHVRSGESCVLIGPNGAGKTTLFDAIAGQNGPASGRIAYQGADSAGKTALWRARHGIRRTFQRQQTFPGLTVEDNVLVALEWDHPHPVADILGLPQPRRRGGPVGGARGAALPAAARPVAAAGDRAGDRGPAPAGAAGRADVGHGGS